MPAIVGELLSGVLLGPTVLGKLRPALFHHVFASSHEATELRQLCAKLGLFLFLFLAGTEVTLASLKQRTRATVWVSIFGMLLPFGLGTMAVLWQPAWWSHYSNLSSPHLALLIGTALSISALPVIARILMDLRMMNTAVASVVITAATCDDVIGWLLFSWILMSHHSAVPLVDVLPLMMFWIGIFAAKPLRNQEQVRQIFYTCTMSVFAPVYFVSIGLGTDFVSYGDVTLVGGVLLIACIGKVGGALIGGWIGRMPWRETCAVAFAMNARGAVGVLLASLALEAQLIGEPLFVALVVMAIVTSVLAGPMIRILFHAAPASFPPDPTT